MRAPTGFRPLLSFLVMLGCAAGPAPDSGFLADPKQLHPSESIPFNDVWLNEGTDFTVYDTVVVAPIDTTHLEGMDWWDRFSLAQESGSANPAAEAKTLADYFRTQLTQTLLAGKNKPGLAATPSGSSLQVELAIVKVVPTKVWLNSIGYVAAGALDHGTTAMEGRIRDLQSNQIVAAFKDEQYGRTSLISVADLAWYSHSKHSIDYWSTTLEALLRSKPGTKLQGRSTVTLRPW